MNSSGQKADFHELSNRYAELSAADRLHYKELGAKATQQGHATGSAFGEAMAVVRRKRNRFLRSASDSSFTFQGVAFSAETSDQEWHELHTRIVRSALDESGSNIVKEAVKAERRVAKMRANTALQVRQTFHEKHGGEVDAMLQGVPRFEEFPKRSESVVV